MAIRIPEVYTLNPNQQQAYFEEKFEDLKNSKPKPTDRSVEEALRVENIPPFYPTFTPLLSERVTKEAVESLSAIDDYIRPSAKEEEVITGFSKLQQQERTKFLKQQSTDYLGELKSLDQTLSGMIDEVSFQFRSLVDYLNEGTPKSLPFSYGPFDPTIDITPFGGVDREAKARAGSSGASSYPHAPWRAAMFQKKKKKDGASQQTKVSFTEIEEGGDKIPMMSLSIEDLLNTAKKTGEGEGEAVGETASVEGEKRKLYLIPRYSITHKQRNIEKESQEEKTGSETLPEGTPSTLNTTSTSPTPIIRGYGDTKWMRNRIETVVDAYKLTCAEAAAVSRTFAGK